MQLSWSDGKDILNQLMIYKPFPKYEHDKIVLAYTIESKLNYFQNAPAKESLQVINKFLPNVNIEVKSLTRIIKTKTL